MNLPNFYEKIFGCKRWHCLWLFILRSQRIAEANSEARQHSKGHDLMTFLFNSQKIWNYITFSIVIKTF